MKWFSPKMYTVLTALFAVAVLNLFFSMGICISPVASEQQTARVVEPTVECRLVERHTVQYVEKPVTVTEYVEQIKRVPVELRNFSDLEELKQWLKDRGNVTTVRFQSPGVTIDCDDYALDMQHKALADGYIMSFEVIGGSEYNALFNTSLPTSQTLHAINLAIINNSVYYVEPQTGEVAFAVHLD